MKPLRGGKRYNGASTTPQTVDGWDRHLVLSVCGTHTYWTLSGTYRLTDYVHFGSRQKSKSVSILSHPPQPSCWMTITVSDISPDLLALAVEAKLSADRIAELKTFLVNHNLLTVDAFAVAVSKETLDSKLIPLATTSGFRAELLGDVGALKLLWHLCSEAFKRGEGVSTTLDDGKPLAQPQYAALKSKWDDTHKFKFSSFRILAPLVMAKMWKHCTSSPKLFVLLYVEELKLKSSLTKSDFTAMQLKSGEVPQSSTVQLETVQGIATLRDKIEAQFNTWAFVSIHDTSWFSFQDALNFMDHINDLFRRRYEGGSRPNLQFFINAYTKTMQYFQDQVIIFDFTLKHAVNNLAGWMHLWNGWVPPQKAPSGGDHSMDTLPQTVKQEMNSLRQMLRSLQSHKHGTHDHSKSGHHDTTWKVRVQKNKWKKLKGKGNVPPKPPAPPAADDTHGKGNSKKGKGKGKKGKGKKGKW